MGLLHIETPKTLSFFPSYVLYYMFLFSLFKYLTYLWIWSVKVWDYRYCISSQNLHFGTRQSRFFLELLPLYFHSCCLNWNPGSGLNMVFSFLCLFSMKLQRMSCSQINYSYITYILFHLFIICTKTLLHRHYSIVWATPLRLAMGCWLKWLSTEKS